MNSLNLEIKQNLNMTQQLVQAVTILAMSGQELNDMVDKELLENPVLELVDNTATIRLDDRWMQHYRQKEDGDAFYAMAETPGNLQDQLMDQVVLCIKTEKEKTIAEYIIGSLNESGYLEQPLAAIAKKLSVTAKEVDCVRQIIQELDPIGFASLNVQEFLLLQLSKRTQDNKTQLAQLIIEKYLEALSEEDFESISMDTDKDIDLVKEAAALIRHLNPRPINAWLGKSGMQYITPDIMIEKIEDKFVVSLNPIYTRTLRIQDEYAQMRKSVDSDTKKYISKNIRSATWIIQCLQQREKTIRKISEIIVELQHDFLEHGPLYMQPLTLREVAKLVGVHESTVSRTLSNKYAQTPHGTIPLKSFFPSGICCNGGNKINCAKIQRRIAEIVKSNQKLSDQKIADMLSHEGISIARRTVAKYRDIIGLKSSFNRKKS